MKNILIFILCSIYYYETHAQCDNNVNTNYSGTPLNNALPINNSNAYLNSFDWIPRNANQELEKYTTNGMNSGLLLPFNQINNIYSNQVNPFYKYLSDELEPFPENGWELIGVNLGYFPNGSTLSSEYNDLPYIILYNRYSGILRVFGILGPGYGAFGTSINAVVVKLGFKNNQIAANGLFRLASGKDQSLDKLTTVTSIGSVCEHQNVNGKWFSADFQMAYDPCVCFWKSEISTSFEFIEKETVDLEINGFALARDLISTNTVNDQLEFINSFNSIPSDIDPTETSLDEGYLIYKEMYDLLNQYIAELEEYESQLVEINEHNSKIKRNKYLLKALSFVFKTGSLALFGPEGAEISTGLQSYAPEFLTQGGSISDKIFNKENFEALGKGISTYVGNNFLQTNTLEAPVGPSANPVTTTFFKAKAKGTFKKSTSIHGPTIITPGSYGGQYVDGTDSSPIINSPSQYPVYNEAMGQFALLKSPKLNFYTGVVNNECHPTQYSEDYCMVTSSFDYLQQFQLAEPLYYTINPTLDIESYEIEASIGSEMIIVENLNSPIPYAINNTELTANVESLFYNFNLPSGQIAKVGDLPNESAKISTPFLPLNAFGSTVGSLATRHNYSKTFQGNNANGDYICNNAFGYEFTDISKHNHLKISNNKFYLQIKLTVNYQQKKSDGSANEYIYLFTYEIDKENVATLENPITESFSSTFSDYGNFKKDLYLYNTVFDGSFVDGCVLNGNTYTCKAWNDVYVSGDLNVTPGFLVNVSASNNVFFEPESTIPTESIFSIAPFLDLSSPMPKQTVSEVLNFCSDKNLYKAKNSTKSVIIYNELERISNENSPFSFQLFPNPTRNTTTVLLEGPGSKEARISVFDLSGKEMQVRIEANENRYNLDVAHLAKGLYFVKVSTFGEAQTKQLVVQ